MSIIKKINIKNFLGLEELGLDCSKINLIKGPKGSGKSSIIEAIEKTFTNKNRRTEVVRHGEDEATLYLELDNGLEIDRKIRNEKADYLKVRKENESVPSTEKFLRSLINGDIFRPLDWVNMSIKDQTKSILGMLEIDWSQDDILNWFGDIPSNVDYTEHILQILKAIEIKYFNEREEINRRIKELKIQMKNILDELPAEYDGETWRNVKVQEYYSEVSKAQEINNLIEKAKSLQEGFENKVQAIKEGTENSISKVELKYRELESDIKDIVDLSKNKIEKAKEVISSVGEKQSNIKTKLEIEEEKEIQVIKEKYRNLVIDKVKEVEKEAEEQKELIQIQEQKIAAKESELLGLDDKKQFEIQAVKKECENQIELVKAKIGEASQYLNSHEPIDITELQHKADKVAEMQSYLRQWDMYIDIRDNKLSPKQQLGELLTVKISKARKLPQELLAIANMPIEGISVDGEGLIRINGILIDGLSDGEKLELAMKIAKAQAGELKVICVDKFESLNPAAQDKILNEMQDDEYQYFITSTMSDEFEIEKRD